MSSKQSVQICLSLGVLLSQGKQAQPSCGTVRRSYQRLFAAHFQTGHSQSLLSEANLSEKSGWPHLLAWFYRAAAFALQHASGQHRMLESDQRCETE